MTNYKGGYSTFAKPEASASQVSLNNASKVSKKQKP